MAQKAFAIGDFVVNDEEGLEKDNATIHSALQGGVGLPQVAAELSALHGRWPVFAAVRRPGHRLTLMTRFRESTSPSRYTQRRDLLAELNPEDEEAVRLVVADQLPPEGLLAAFGPWDIYEDDDGDWHVRDVLDTIEADLSGAVHFEDGEEDRQRAIVIEEESMNYVVITSWETGLAGWTTVGFATYEASTVQAKYGVQSLHCISDAAADYAYSLTIAEADGGETWTASCWVYLVSGDFKLTIQENAGGWSDKASANADTSLLNQWQRVIVTTTLTGGVTDGRIKLGPNATAASEFYVDGVQFEEKGYATTYIDGSLGPGYTWSGAAHASTSTRAATEFNLDDEVSLISEEDTLSFRVVFQAPYAATGTWPLLGNNFIFGARGANDENRISLTFDSTDDKFSVYINGGYRIDSTAQTFIAGDLIELLVTLDFGNDSYALYVDGDAEGTSSAALSVPTLTQWNLGSTVTVTNCSNLTISEYTVWDRALTADEADTMCDNLTVAGRARHVDVICEAAQPLVIGDKVTGKGTVGTLAVDGDVRWRYRDGDVHFWRVYDDTWNHVIDVDSDDDVYPVIRITPGTAKTVGYNYKRWAPIVWKADSSAFNYPTLLGPIDTTGLVPAKMQADGDDWRVFVDGIEVDRWFGGASGAAGGPNHATTKTWINLDFQAKLDMTLKTAIAGAGGITEIELNEDITNLPSSGILLIGTEAFTYTDKNVADQKVTGITRDAKGTAQAAHAVDADVYWIQHDAWILYGNAAATAPTTNDDYKPVFELDTSTNASWVYQEFGEDDGLRGGNWVQQTVEGAPEFYGGNRGAAADPWIELGILNQIFTASGALYLYNPCGITNANFTNGEKYGMIVLWFGDIESSTTGGSWTTEYEIPTLTADNTWEAWSRNEALTSGSRYVRIVLDGGSAGYPYYLEAADCTITLGPDTPTHTINSEQTMYPLECTITNETTGDMIELTVMIDLDETLEVDTDEKTITYLADGSRQMQALTLVGGCGVAG